MAEEKADLKQSSEYKRGHFKPTFSSGNLALKSVLLSSVDDVDLNNIQLDVVSCSKLESGTKKSILYYEIQLTTDRYTWKVFRTEKEFLELHKKVVAKKAKNITFPGSRSSRSIFSLKLGDDVKKEKTEDKKETTEPIKRKRAHSKLTRDDRIMSVGPTPNVIEPELSSESEGADENEARVNTTQHKKRNPITKSRSHTVADSPITKMSKHKQFQGYCEELSKLPHVISSPLFRDFIDPTHNPSAFFLSRVSDLRCSFQVQKDKDVYCVVYGGQIYVFKSMTALSMMYTIDLQLAHIDLALKQEPGVTTFEVIEERNEKIYTIKSRVESHAHEWIAECRKSRTKDSIPHKDLLKYVNENTISNNEIPESPRLNPMNLVSSKSTSDRVRQMHLLFSGRNNDTLKKEDLIGKKDSDTNTKFDENGNLVAASKAKLFEKLCVGKIDPWAFVYTFPLFVSPQEVFDHIEFRFSQTRSGDNSNIHIVKFILIWIKQFWSDFDGSSVLLFGLISFCKSGMQSFPELKDQIEQIDLHITKKSHKQTSKAKEETDFEPPILPRYFGSGKFELYDLSPTEITRQMTLKSSELWQTIHLREFLYWNTKQQSTKSKSVLEFVEHFNHCTHYSSLFILSGCTPRQRGYFIMHIIDILEKAYKMENFHIVMALISSLESAAISRLKKSWAVVTDKHKEVVVGYKNLFSATNNWKDYREMLSQCGLPCVPYIGVYLQDLVFIDDGNDDTYGPNNLINWYKCSLFANRVLSPLHKLQHGKYNFQPVPEIREYLEKLNNKLTDKEMYQISLALEPREG